jgi:hypothetical protein
MVEKVFEQIESYKHRFAKLLLKIWLLPDFLSVRVEEPVIDNGFIIFVPDIVCYGNDRTIVYEVTHKNPLDAKKLNIMQQYYWNMGISVIVYEISSEWILCQIRKPEEIKALKMIDFTF